MTVDPVTGQRLACYRLHRERGQASWYQLRRDEFRRARRQASRWTAYLLVLSASASTAATAGVAGGRWWAVVAAGCAAVATAVTSYAAMHQYETLEREYGRAVGALGRLAPACPDPAAASASDVTAYVDEVEAILRGEVEGWFRSATPREK